ncbi:MAG: hypothetical protein H0U82_01380 [Actinobacteria bacterium]|nr:hypothetical protein [Actinomycetota bacterium]
MRGDAGLAPATSARAHAGLPGSAHRISPGLGSPPCFVAERRRSEGSAIPRGGHVAGLPGLPGAGSCTRERFERLFADHREALLAYALRRATQEAAEDVVVDAFMVVWRRLDDVPHDARPWLFGVARRVLADQRRNAWRRASLPARVATQPPATRSRRSRAFPSATASCSCSSPGTGLRRVRRRGRSGSHESRRACGCTGRANGWRGTRRVGRARAHCCGICE